MSLLSEVIFAISYPIFTVVSAISMALARAKCVFDKLKDSSESPGFCHPKFGIILRFTQLNIFSMTLIAGLRLCVFLITFYFSLGSLMPLYHIQSSVRICLLKLLAF